MSLLFYVLSLPALCASHGRLLNSSFASRPQWSGTTVQDLWNEYYNIFPTHNRNAAAYKWSTFIFERSWQMDASTFEHLASGYCAVAASIVNPQKRTRYRLELGKIGGGVQSGLMYYCCWPCICDTLDFLRVDTKTIQLKGEKRKYHFAVMGDPCKNPIALTTPYTDPFSGQPSTLQQDAPEVECSVDGKLKGATRSDNGYIIMSMFFNDQGHPSNEQSYFTGFDGSPCEKRAAGGYQSGMGLIFRKVAGASPIQSFAAQKPNTEKLAPKSAFRASLQKPLGSAAIHPPSDILTCPNGEAGVARSFLKRLVNISKTAAA